MAPLNRNFLLLALVIALCHVHGLGLRTSEIKGEDFSLIRHKTTVRIHNDIGNGMNLTLHCKSKNNDLGTHVIPNGDFFQWKFRINVWETTLFFCGVSWEKARGNFDIYVADRDKHRCRQCVWRVKEDGAHGYNGEDGEEQLWFRWGEKPPT